jgi:pantetheine-phosphate adenylyltransferase
MEKVVIYPGSFDPITNGHIDLIKRGLGIFDKLVIAVARNFQKWSLFTVEERLEMIDRSLEDINDRIIVDYFDGLLVDYLKKRNARVVLRGLRAVSDFDYEFQMSLMNRKMNRQMETVFLMTGYQWLYTSSRIIKEAVAAGGSAEGLVPDFVNKKLKEKFSGRGKGRNEVIRSDR